MNITSVSRNPWPFAIMAFFAVLISCIVAFIIFATRNKMELVNPNYYEDEMRFQQQIDRVTRTRALPAGVAAAYDAKQETITITLPPEHGRLAASGRIELYRPSDSKLDRHLPLALNSNGSQTVDVNAMRSGLWKLRVQWKAGGDEFFFDQSVFITKPSS
jgi:nitrogen fixation protein FixH